MLCYRACNHIEAGYQTVGKPRKAPPEELIIRSVKTDGLFATMFPEVWRRYQNQAAKLTGYFWDYTLLLEVPDDKLIEIEEGHGLAGMEYKVERPQDAIVRGIAGPDWSSLPDWVPQPENKEDWDPTSTNWQGDDAAHIFYWTPRGVSPRNLWYHPTQLSQRKRFQEHCRQLRAERTFGVVAEVAKQAGFGSFLDRF